MFHVAGQTEPGLEEGSDPPVFSATIIGPGGDVAEVDVIPLDERLYSAFFADTGELGDYRVTVTGALTRPSGDATSTTSATKAQAPPATKTAG